MFQSVHQVDFVAVEQLPLSVLWNCMSTSKFVVIVGKIWMKGSNLQWFIHISKTNRATFR